MSYSAKPRRFVIMGAAGRDFHNFNMVFREDATKCVVAFTAAQIPGIAGRRYPASLAGSLYPDGIPILDEDELETIVTRERIDEVIFAYSDVTHDTVMHAASRSLACGADFSLMGPHRTMLQSNRRVIAVTAVRTGCGKSQIARWLSKLLRQYGLRVAVLRHPMPYGDLEVQRVQRFADFADLDAANCTHEEREEYEPHIASGGVVFAGVDYREILSLAEQEADIIVWDGGNNDFSFIRPDLNIVVADALRPNQVMRYHPGEAVLRSADVVVVNKVDVASKDDTERVVKEVRSVNAGVPIVHAASPITLDKPDAIRGKRVLVVEDGPTITHGGLAFGAGYVAAKAFGASAIVDPRLSAPAQILAIYERYPHIGPVLPDVGYQPAQRDALKRTIVDADAEVVLVAAPLDLRAMLGPDRPVVRVRYEFAETGEPTLTDIVGRFLSGSR